MQTASHDFLTRHDDQVGQRVRHWMSGTSLRLTVMRLSVVRVLERAADPMSAETLYRVLCERGSTFSLATTYRILKELETSGLVGREMHQDALGIRSYYAIQMIVRPPRVCYFQCDLCSVRRRLPAPALIDQLVNAATHEGYQAQAELVVIARCAECQAR